MAGSPSTGCSSLTVAKTSRSVTLSATGADPEGTAVTFAWDLDGNGSVETPGQSVSEVIINEDVIEKHAQPIITYTKEAKVEAG